MDATRLITDHHAGIAFQYVIINKSESSSNRNPLVRKLAHTDQSEKLGRKAPFFAWGPERMSELRICQGTPLKKKPRFSPIVSADVDDRID